MIQQGIFTVMDGEGRGGPEQEKPHLELHQGGLSGVSPDEEIFRADSFFAASKVQSKNPDQEVPGRILTRVHMVRIDVIDFIHGHPNPNHPSNRSHEEPEKSPLDDLFHWRKR